jgi:hypothetical protein
VSQNGSGEISNDAFSPFGNCRIPGKKLDTRARRRNIAVRNVAALRKDYALNNIISSKLLAGVELEDEIRAF